MIISIKLNLIIAFQSYQINFMLMLYHIAKLSVWIKKSKTASIGYLDGEKPKECNDCWKAEESIGSNSIAQAYAGHQFGHWVPQLGDGRAVLLGEVIDNKGNRRDIQLKGSGPTPFSRMGDGRAWLGPILREYIVSEAMYKLNIPTTRALSAISTGENIYREQEFPGAILTRVAQAILGLERFQYLFCKTRYRVFKNISRSCN